MDDNMQVEDKYKDMSGIYAIINTRSDAAYIGCTTTTFSTRMQGHIMDLNRGRHSRDLMQAHWYLFGEDVFVFKVVEIIDPSDHGSILDRERYWIENCREFGDICYNNTNIEIEPLHSIKTELDEADFDLAVMSNFFSIGKGEHVTIYLPTWLRREVSLLAETSKMRESKIYSRLIGHGATLLKKSTKDIRTSLTHSRTPLLESDNTTILRLLQEYNVRFDRIDSGKRYTANVSVWSRECLETIGSTLNIDLTSMIRMAMYTSIQQCKTLTPSGREACDYEISQFYKNMGDYSHVCAVLANSESDIQIVQME